MVAFTLYLDCRDLESKKKKSVVWGMGHECPPKTIAAGISTELLLVALKDKYLRLFWGKAEGEKP